MDTFTKTHDPLPAFGDGLPGTLLVKDSRGLPRYYGVLHQLSERGYRHRLARLIRRSSGRNGSDQEVIEHDLKRRRLRQVVFWEFVREGHAAPRGRGRRVSQELKPVSLEMRLLGDMARRLSPPPFDEPMFAAECNEWPAIRQNIEILAGVPCTHIHRAALEFLMCWPALRDAVAGWDGLAPDHWPTLEAIFALSSITDSPWFLNEALQRCPASRRWLDEICEGAAIAAQALGSKLVEKDVNISPDVDSDVIKYAPDASYVEPDWQALGAALQEMGARLAGELPTQWEGEREAMLATLENARSALKTYDPGRAIRNQLAVTLQEIGARLSGFAKQPAFVPLMPDLQSRLEAWQALVHTRAPQELERIGSPLRSVLEDFDRCEPELRDAYAALMEARRSYEAARQAAEINPQLAARLVANQHRESDLAAEKRLLRVQVEFIELLPKAPPPEDAPAVEPEGAFAGDARTTQSFVASSEAAPAPCEVPVRPSSEEVLEHVPHVERATVAAEAQGDLGGGLHEVVVPQISADAAGPAGDYAVSGSPAYQPPPDPAVSEQTLTAVDDAPSVSTAPVAKLRTLSAEDIWRALRRNDLAAAYQMARLAEVEGMTLPDAPPAPLLRAVALANDLLLPDGEIAAEISDSFVMLDLAGLPEVTAGTYLLLAGAVLRPLLLAPDSIAPQLAAQIRLPDGCGEFYRLLRQFVDATTALRHYRLGARALAALQDSGAWRAELAQLEEEIREWRRRAPHFSIKFAPATAIWQTWQKPDGEIDLLLGPITVNASDAPERVRAQLNRLASGLDKLIEDADRKGKQRGDRIQGAALERFHLRVEEAKRLAEQWLALLAARPVKDGPRTRELDRVRAALENHRLPAGRELEQLSQHSDSRVAAAALIARTALVQTWALFEPQPPTVERSPRLLLNRPLLELPECTLEHDWSIRGQVRPVLAALASRSGASPNLLASFEMRLAHRDILGATRVAEIATVEDPATAAQMRARLEPATKEYWSQQRRQLAQLGESIESSIVYGFLSSAEGDAYSERLDELEKSFDDLAQAQNIEESLDRIRADIEALSELNRKEIDEDLGRIRGSTDAADLKIIDEAISANDLPSAREYLTRIRDGQRLQHDADVRDPFEELYGGIHSRARDIDGFLVEPGRNSDALIQHIEQGQPIGALVFGDVPEAQRMEAGKLLKRWFELKRGTLGPLVAGDWRIKPLQELLSGLGFTNVRPPNRRGAAQDVLEVDIECDPIAERVICPVPYFGSAANGHYRLLCVSGRTSIDQLLTRVGPTVNSRPTLVLYMGRLDERQRRDLAAESRRGRRCFILIDEVLLVFLTAERGLRLPALFACALPFTSIDPYVTTASFVPPELFFGRHNELDHLLDPMGACFVYGGRQLGKTALLKHAERSFHAPAQQRYAVWIDLKAAGIGWSTEADSTHVWQPIWRRLVDVRLLDPSTPDPRPNVRGRVEQFLASLETWLAEHPAGRVLLLLDEADRFLEDDARHSYRSTTQLKRLMEGSDRRFKVALAGLHNVLRTAEQANHPLGHFGEPIEIGPLIKSSEWREARQLVHGPLAAAGFKLERPGMADRVLAQTNFYPSLIQLYCSKIIARMMEEGRFQSGPRFLIKESKLDETYLSKELREEIRQKFRLTLQLDPRYAVIAYAIAHRSYENKGTRAGIFTAAELAEMARNWWREGFERTSAPEFRIILDEMRGLGVLRRLGHDGPFTLRNPNLLLLMGTQEEVEEELLKPRDLPELFAPQEFHPSLTGPGAIAGCHPLTMTQIAALGARRNGVVILAGTDAAGISRVTEALRQEHGEAYFMCLQAVGETRSFVQVLREGLEARKKDGTTIFLVPQECPWSGAWVEVALVELRKLSSKDRRAMIVFSTDATCAVSAELPDLAELKGVEVMTLRPWTESFIRHWLEERRPADGPAQRQALRGRSGFWPLLLERAKSDGIAVGLEQFAGRHPRLARLLTMLSEWGGPVEPGELAVLMNDTPTSVQRDLRLGELLGVITAAERGSWCLEQGLAVLFQNGDLRG